MPGSCVVVLLLGLAVSPTTLSAQSQTAPADAAAIAPTGAPAVDATTAATQPADAAAIPADAPPAEVPQADAPPADAAAAPADATSAATQPADAAPLPPEQAPSDATAAATSGSAPEGETGRKKPSAYATKVMFHKISGFTSGGLLLASGIVGAVHVFDMMSIAHVYRDKHGMEEVAPECSVKIREAWAGDQTLRWVHVGLLSTGEILYLADAITGLTMLTPDLPGLTKQDIHRYAFFTHAGLMAAEIILGFFTTDALKRGDHNTMLALGITHTAIGLAIPTVIIGAGILAALR
jgi:hypothetical protein